MRYSSSKQREYIKQFESASKKVVISELEEKRNENTKVLKTSDNREVYNIHLSPIHYENNGKWEDIDATLEVVNGKLVPRSAGFSLDAPLDLSHLTFKRNSLEVNFIPLTKSISIEPINTGVRKLVTFDNKPDSNEVEFKLEIPAGSKVFYTDKSLIGKQDEIRKLLSKTDKERLSAEKREEYARAKSLNNEIQGLEKQLQEIALVEWDKSTEVTFEGAMQIRKNEDTVYVRDPQVWDANRTPAPIKIKLTKRGSDLLFIKVLPQDFLDTAEYPIKTDGTASYYAGGGDGYVRYDNASWSTARGATTGSIVDYTNTVTFFCYTTNNFGSSYRIVRSFFPYDTSAIGSGATISSATMYFTYDSGLTNANSSDWDIVSASQASTTSLTTADYNQIGSTVFGSIALSSVSGTFSIALDANGIANISKTGVSKFAARNSRDTDNAAPTGDNDFNGRYSEYSGTGSDPYLSVVTGTSYTKSTTDTTTLVDSKANQTQKAIANALTLVDSMNKSVTSFFTDVVTLVASLSTTSVFTKVLTDVITSVDSVASKISGKTLSENITLVDVLSTLSSYGKSLVEQVVLVASLSTGKMISRTFSEVITLVDSYSTAFVAGRTLTESTSVSDRLVGLLNGVNMKWSDQYTAEVGTWVDQYFDF